jgi:glycosyl transferase family 2
MTEAPDAMPADAMPAVSVLIPCWNAASSIAAALDSVLETHAVPLECVVVDDASTDGSAAIVAAIAARDPRVRLLALDANGGVSNARNRGLELVRGEWLTLLDADDHFRPGGLATLYRTAVDRDALAVVGQQVWSDGRRTWIGRLYDIPDIRAPGRKSLATSPGLLYYVSPHAKLFHRSCWDGLRFEGRVLGDQPWIIRAFLRAGNRIEVVGDTVYDWIRAGEPGAGPSITAATRASVRRGIEAAGIAAGALESVRAEVEARVAEPEARARVLATYTERLLRSDLAAHVSNALARRDPGLGDLFGAIEAFIAAVPPAWLQATDALARDILEPPLRRWRQVPAPARPAFWSLAARAHGLDPDVPRHGSSPVARMALALARPDRAAVLRATGVALLMAARTATAVRRRMEPAEPA